MNWRRGFLRLWLVASVIWLAGNAFAFRLPETLIEVTPWLRPSAANGPPDTPIGNPPRFDPSKPYIVVPHTATPSEEERERRIGSELGLISPREQRREAAIASLRGFVFFGIGAPMAVLFLGIAAMWVLRGFRPINP
jgi:hypothetical protein